MITGMLKIDYSTYLKNEYGIYNEINKKAKEGDIKCSICLGSVAMHGTYKRKIIFSEFDIRAIVIMQVKCKECKRVHSIMPDFVSPNKLYSSQLIDEAINNNDIKTCTADDSTIRRWRKTFGKCLKSK